jgi:uncharacterized protein YndB with AHSA1/START domain
MPDKITRSIDIAAPPSRVWTALTDHAEFGEWFKVALTTPFTPGAESRGVTTYRNYAGLPFAMKVEALEPEARFAFTWPAYAGPDHGNLEHLPWTRVEFRLEPSATGTKVTVTETGFDALPEPIGAIARDGNEGGWKIQLDNLAAYAA